MVCTMLESALDLQQAHLDVEAAAILGGIVTKDKELGKAQGVSIGDHTYKHRYNGLLALKKDIRNTNRNLVLYYEPSSPTARLRAIHLSSQLYVEDSTDQEVVNRLVSTSLSESRYSIGSNWQERET